MPYYFLTWGLEGGLVTVDLASGRRVILVHSDKQIAARHMAVLARRTDQEVALMEQESAEASMKENLESIVGVDLLPGIDLVFPDDPIYFMIVDAISALPTS